MVSLVAETWRRLVSVFCALATVFILGGLSTLSGCRPGVPVIDPGTRPAQSNGTISGTVRGPASQAAIEERTVGPSDPAKLSGSSLGPPIA